MTEQRFSGGGCCGGPCPSNAEPCCKNPCAYPGRDRVFSKMPKFTVHMPCSPENCRIFGSHDQPTEAATSYDMMNLCGKRFKKTRDNWETLGSPVGLVVLPQPQKSNQPNQESIRFATYLKSFAVSFVTSRNEWNPDLIDLIMREGQTLFVDSQNLDSPNSTNNEDVYNESEQKVSRYFKILGYEFKIELEPVFEVWYPKHYPNIIANIRHILKAFFKKKQFALFWTPNWYAFIFKDKGIFFVLDVNGRIASDVTTQQDGGFPMMIVLKSTDNVAHLLANLSNINPTDKFTLREMLVTRLVTPEGDLTEREYGTRMSQYEVVTEDYAYLKSNLHLTLNPKDALRNRSALPVAVASMLAAKIDHPATWDMRTYDKVMCYGVNMCNQCWEPCVDVNQPIDLDTFPRQIRLGQFVAEILLSPNAYEGIWRCVPMYTNNDYHLMLEKALKEADYVLFQINNQMYSLWKKNDFIYLMDPYRHHIVGRILEEGEDPKSASIRMFGTFDRFLSVFHQILLESNRTALFHIHILKIRNITECPPGKAPTLLPPDEEVEVASLNETIDFAENYDKCVDELGQISDYEEDLVSEVEPIEEVSSSEELVEEEEGGEAGGEGGEGGGEEEDE